MDRLGLSATSPATLPEDTAPSERLAGRPAEPSAELVRQLVTASREFDATGADPERNCWLAVHRHVHGVLPSEYDIREINEDLYLAVLAARKTEDTDAHSELS